MTSDLHHPSRCVLFQVYESMQLTAFYRLEFVSFCVDLFLFEWLYWACFSFLVCETCFHGWLLCIVTNSALQFPIQGILFVVCTIVVLLSQLLVVGCVSPSLCLAGWLTDPPLSFILLFSYWPFCLHSFPTNSHIFTLLFYPCYLLSLPDMFLYHTLSINILSLWPPLVPLRWGRSDGATVSASHHYSEGCLSWV